ncbi:Alpha/Beta hydrolase protein [Exophiala viscosa]|uniref:Alpha/Beta hydrolase protein n=1 Tax=Exophiala viscosa TaxID=2486360 RepID=UPI00218ED25C|nr:Alpha/Beta hydrolase protein [Exophiala viscosa]
MSYHKISPALQINYTVHNPSSSLGHSKPWIILINGLADPQTTWVTQISTFTEAGYTVLTYDNRGIGLSSRPSSPNELWTADDMASDLRSLVLALKVPTPYHILGISMGGMIAQQYALRYGLSSPSEILSLNPTCTYAAPGPFCSRMFCLWGDMARRMSIADVMRDVLLYCFTPAWFADSAKQDELKAIEAEMAAVDKDMGLDAYLAQLNVITEFDTRHQVGKLAEVGMHVNVIAGEGDILIPNILSRELHSLIPGSRWRTVTGGHACNWEFPDEFNQVCLEEFKIAEEKLAS